MTAVPPDQVATPGHSLSVVIPAYNEEAYVERCITALESVLIDIAVKLYRQSSRIRTPVLASPPLKLLTSPLPR